VAKKLSVTPRGVAVYPHLTQPDTKFDSDGIYHIKVQQPLDVGSPLQDVLDAAVAQCVVDTKKDLNAKIAATSDKAEKQKLTKLLAKAKPCENLPYAIDEEAGTITFSFKMNATGKKKDGTPFTRKPALFDAAGVPLSAEVKIGGGSVVRVSYELNPFFTALAGCGVSLRLYAVQVIELKEFGGNAEYFGFENEGEGIPATVDPLVEETETEAPTPATPAKDDF